MIAIIGFVTVLIIILIFTVGLLFIECLDYPSSFSGGMDAGTTHHHSHHDHKKRGYSDEELKEVSLLYAKMVDNNATKDAYTKGLQKALTSPAMNPIVTFDDIPEELPYTKHAKLPKRSVHIGQRKLFDNEVQFCTESVGTKPAIVFYAGAAPCNKGAYLASLFPNICFVLIDPNKFDIHLEDYKIQVTRWSEYKESLTKERVDEIISKIVSNFINNSTSTVANNNRINIINDLMTIELATAIAKYCVGDYTPVNKDKKKKSIKGSAMDRAFAEFLGSDDDSNDSNDINDSKKVPIYYFMSDIRTDALGGKNPDAIDILWNNAQQFNWLQIMKNSASLFQSAMLKFRHPFYEDAEEEFYTRSVEEPLKTDFGIAKKNGIDFIANYATKTLEYYDGIVYIQPFGGISTTETRLVTDCSKIKSWGTNSQYTDKFFYFNNILRGYQLFKNPNADRRLGFDYCSDCALENQIWERYIEVCGKFVSKVNRRPIPTVIELVEKLSKVTHRPLIRDRHGKLFGRIPIHILLKDGKEGGNDIKEDDN